VRWQAPADQKIPQASPVSHEDSPAKQAIIDEWIAWLKEHPEDTKVMSGMLFFTHLQEKHADLLLAAGDKWQTIHAWLNGGPTPPHGQQPPGRHPASHSNNAAPAPPRVHASVSPDRTSGSQREWPRKSHVAPLANCP
jgi:hypothetical protein